MQQYNEGLDLRMVVTLKWLENEMLHLYVSFGSYAWIVESPFISTTLENTMQGKSMFSHKSFNLLLNLYLLFTTNPTSKFENPHY